MVIRTSAIRVVKHRHCILNTRVFREANVITRTFSSITSSKSLEQWQRANTLGQTHWKAQRFDHADEMFSYAAKLRSSYHDVTYATSLLNLAKVRLHHDRVDESLEIVGDAVHALRLHTDNGNAPTSTNDEEFSVLCNALLLKAELHLRRDEDSEALSCSVEALHAARTKHDAVAVARASLSRVQILAKPTFDSSSQHRFVSIASDAVACAQDAFSASAPLYVAMTMSNAARMLHAKQFHDEAKTYCTDAITLYKSVGKGDSNTVKLLLDIMEAQALRDGANTAAAMQPMVEATRRVLRSTTTHTNANSNDNNSDNKDAR